MKKSIFEGKNAYDLRMLLRIKKVPHVLNKTRLGDRAYSTIRIRFLRLSSGGVSQ